MSLASVDGQRGAFPTHVGRYLQENMDDIGENIIINVNNTLQQDEVNAISVEDLGLKTSNGGLFGRTFNLVDIPDVGYNVQIFRSRS